MSDGDGAMIDIDIPVASAVGVTHRYKNLDALSNITLEVPSRQMVGLLGPDGVGKSTLLGLLAGARKLQSGQVHVLDGDMSLPQHRRRVGPRIAYMPQGLGRNLYQDLSIAENLDFFGKLYGQGRDERRSRIERLTAATGLHPFLNRPVGKLSGGMKQKLGLCCALIHDPDFMILDEPTTGVDPLARRQFWELIAAIRNERPEMSVLVSTAYMEEAEAFDWLVAMDAGRILAAGTPAGLKQKTDADDLETAFVRLLPAERRDGRGHLEIPPFDQQTERPAIAAKNLTRRFGDFTAVDQVSFEIQQGEIFGFLGSNGCGKTTTMKMLTGLLPASEGEAHIFGQPLRPHDMETRKRVGFMSQLFSLYGELTVAQNLYLHARLFHLGPNKTEQRVNLLVEQFGLRRHMGSLASALPLGIRQRLSLAVAIIHEPEILILDEPTSGVDPIARDEFWKLLVELSRRDKVTIFISTHFMNEALRCDRMSAHARRQSAGLRNAARHHRRTWCRGHWKKPSSPISRIAAVDSGEVPGKTAAAITATPTSASVPTASYSQASGFSPSRALAYTYREAMEVMRDRVRLAFAFIGSTILLFIFSYGITTDVNEVSFAVLDQDRSPQSRAYIRHYRGSRYFREMGALSTFDEMDARFKSSRISIAIHIPAQFGRDLKRRHPAGSVGMDRWCQHNACSDNLELCRRRTQSFYAHPFG